MITTTFPDHADPTKPFPKIMRSENSGAVILFSRESVGTIVHPGQTSHVIGNHVDYFDMEPFRDYNGPVTLQNK